MSLSLPFYVPLLGTGLLLEREAMAFDTNSHEQEDITSYIISSCS